MWPSMVGLYLRESTVFVATAGRSVQEDGEFIDVPLNSCKLIASMLYADKEYET